MLRSLRSGLALLLLPLCSLTAQRWTDTAIVALDSPAPALLSALSNSCSGRVQPAQRLCEGIVALNRAEEQGSKDDVVRARDLFERIVAERPSEAIGWYGLGLARRAAARVKVVSRLGPLHPVGVSNEAGAGYALIRALELDSTLTGAAEALAVLPMPREGKSRLGERAAMLRRMWPALSAGGLYGAALVAVEAGDAAAAIEAMNLGLTRVGVDSGLAMLLIARAEYANGSPERGRSVLLSGAGHQSELATAAYRRELSWVATPAELTAWDSLSSGEERTRWLTHFWSSRDVTEGRADGARLVEHYRRMEIAYQVYRLDLPASGRHKNSQFSKTIDYGEVEEFLSDIYRSADEGIAQIAIYDRAFGTSAMLRAYRFTQSLLDDRGVVFIRQGPPDATAKTSDGVAYEVWRYERRGEPLILSFKEEDFDGQAGASALVPTLINIDPIQRDQLCHLDFSLCSANADPSILRYAQRYRIDAGKNSLSRRENSRVEGTLSIAQATTTDRYERDLGKRLTPIVQLYGLTHDPSGAGRAVATFAIPGDQLSYTQPDGPAGRAIYALHLEVMTVRAGDGQRAGLDTLRRFATPHPLKSGEYLTGSLEMPMVAGSSLASVVISQEDRGAMLTLPALTTCGTNTRLCLSDLVLGMEGSGVQWNSGRQLVSLNPLNAFPKGGSAELYYQVSGRIPGTRYQSVVELFEAADTALRKPRLTIRFADDANAERAEVQRSLLLADLSPGRYRLRMTVSGAGGSAASTSWLTISARGR